MDVNICSWDCPESCTSCWDEAVVTMVNKGPAGDVTYDVCIDGKIHATGYPGKALRIRECEAEEEPPETGPVALGRADFGLAARRPSYPPGPQAPAPARSAGLRLRYFTPPGKKFLRLRRAKEVGRSHTCGS